MRRCCKCKKQALLMPYVCPDCLIEVMDAPSDKEGRLMEILKQASKILNDNGFTDESKALNLMAGI